MEELTKNVPVYIFLPSIKKYHILKACGIPFGLKKGKSENFTGPAQTYLHFWMNLLNTRDRKSLSSCIAECDWRESRLPWLDKVLLCLVGVGLK